MIPASVVEIVGIAGGIVQPKRDMWFVRDVWSKYLVWKFNDDQLR